MSSISPEWRRPRTSCAAVFGSARSQAPNGALPMKSAQFPALPAVLLIIPSMVVADPPRGAPAPSGVEVRGSNPLGCANFSTT